MKFLRIYGGLYKAFKLAEAGAARRQRRQQAADDSGIDSDDEAMQRQQARENFALMQALDSGSSDEEIVLGSPKMKWAKRQYVNREYHESESSDDDLVLRSPKWTKNKYEERMENLGIAKRDCEVLIPMLVWQQPRDDSDNGPITPASPDRSSPLYEVELTASDEEEDGSVLELVIPFQSSKYNSAPNIPPLTAFEVVSFFGTMFCCFRGF